MILGNHRDAWVFGAVDPSSATAVLRSLAKAIGYLRSTAGEDFFEDYIKSGKYTPSKMK